MTAAERVARCKARKKAGLVRLQLWVDALWTAEALACAGYGHPDSDGREALQAAAQRLLDDLTAEARTRGEG